MSKRKYNDIELPSVEAVLVFGSNGEFISAEIYSNNKELNLLRAKSFDDIKKLMRKSDKDSATVSSEDECCINRVILNIGGEEYNGSYRKNDNKNTVLIISHINKTANILNDAMIKRAAINQFVEPMIITDDKPRILWANKAWSKMTGYTLSEAAGKNPSEIVKSGKMQEVFYKSMWAPLIEDKSWFGRIINRRKDGRLYTEEMEISPFFDSEGNKYYLAQKKEIYIDKDLYTTAKGDNASKLFEITNNLMVLLGKDGTIQNINHNGATLLGYEKQELIGKNWFETFIPDNITEELINYFNNILSGDRELEKDHTNEVITRNGEIKTISWHNEYYTDAEGNITAVISSGTDITELVSNTKRIEEQNVLLSLSREISELIQKTKEKHTLLSKILEVIKTKTGIRASWFAVLDGSGEIETLESFGFSPKDIEKFRHTNQLSHFTACIKQTRKNTFCLIENKENNDQCKSCPLYEYEKNGKALINRLIYKNNNIGYWVILMDVNYELSKNKIEFLNTISENTAVALYNIHIENEKQILYNQLQASETKYKTIVNASLNAIFVVDDNFTIEFANDSAYSLLGYKPEEIIGTNVKKVLAPESAEFGLKRYKERQEGKNVPSKYEITLLHKDGSKRYVYISAKVLKINGENKTYVSLNDITKLKKSTQHLRESEKRYRMFFDLDLSADYISSPSGELIDCNPAFLKLIGFESLEDALMCDPEDFYPKGYSREEFVKEIKEKRFVENRERYYRTVSGKTISVLENSVGIFDENDELVQIHGYMIDISAIKEHEKKLHEAMLKAQESDNLKTAFLNNISHEIRTPMNHILGFAHLLHDGSLDEKTRKSMLDTIEKSGNDLLNLINDIIEFSKIDSGQINFHYQNFDLNGFLQSFIEENNDKAGYYENRKTIKCTNDLTQEFFINTDKKRLEQVLNILLSNALKFSYDCDITISYSQENGFLHFQVKDTGIGIKKQYLKTIFERFRKLSNPGLQTIGGTGLGLALAKEIITKSGGEIYAESDYGIGSVFHFKIPMQEQSRFSISEKNKRNKKNMKGLKILIAEDDESNFQLLKILLTPFKPEILRAWHGAEAIDAVKENDDIDLILMDLKMPVMDGFMATTQIKKIKPEIPVIAQTAYALIGDEAKAKSAGCDFYISKPLNHQKLKDIIEKALNID